MQITASMVKQLRERTGAAMMECKKALTESQGDMEAAAELMRQSGQAKAEKKAGRVAAEGMIMTRTSDDGQTAAIVEVNCETDFVAKDPGFQAFTHSLAALVLANDPADLESLQHAPLPDDPTQTVESARQALVTKIGENIQLRRFDRIQADGGHLGQYLHGLRIGVLVDLRGGNAGLARDIAMHVAASQPRFVDAEDVPREVRDKEHAFLTSQAQESGKPADIIEKMVQGRLRKYLGEITLTGQPFVKDPDKDVGKLLQEHDAKVVRFSRFEVGEGIERQSGDFAEEVMAQVRES